VICLNKLVFELGIEIAELNIYRSYTHILVCLAIYYSLCEISGKKEGLYIDISWRYITVSMMIRFGFLLQLEYMI